MRFMLLIKGDSEPGVLPSNDLIAAMGKYNEDLAKAGVLLAGEGLLASATGARVNFSDGKRTVTDGPFAETKELVAGFWLIQVSSKEEAIEWAKRCPFEAGAEYGSEGQIEVRQVAEMSDFPDMTDELRADEQRLRDQLAGG